MRSFDSKIHRESGGGRDSLLWIIGPCMLESQLLVETVASQIKHVLARLKERFGHEPGIVFKGSFDKANRTSINSERGPGLERGLELLQHVKTHYNFKVTTDVHSIEQVEKVGAVVDLIQIPAFLCRQTDLLVAAGKTGKAVNVKKGQFMAPEDMFWVVDKLEYGGCSDILLTERGTSFGYHDLVSDIRSIPKMRQVGYPVIYDCSHSTQQPSREAGKSGGNYKLSLPLAAAAVAAGADGVFVETHPEPTIALSDGPTSTPLRDLYDLVAYCEQLRAVAVRHGMPEFELS